MLYLEFFSFVVDSVIIIYLLLYGKTSLERIRRIRRAIEEQNESDNVFFPDQREHGNRWYDKDHICPLERYKKGGDSL